VQQVSVRIQADFCEKYTVNHDPTSHFSRRDLVRLVAASGPRLSLAQDLHDTPSVYVRSE